MDSFMLNPIVFSPSFVETAPDYDASKIKKSQWCFRVALIIDN